MIVTIFSQEKSQHFGPTLPQKPGHTKLSLDEHLLMLEIVKSGDAKKGEIVLVEHIGRTRDAYSLEVSDVAAADQNNETAG